MVYHFRFSLTLDKKEKGFHKKNRIYFKYIDFTITFLSVGVLYNLKLKNSLDKEINILAFFNNSTTNRSQSNFFCPLK